MRIGKVSNLLLIMASTWSALSISSVSEAGITTLSSITQISNGTTIHFEEENLSVAEILAPHEMTYENSFGIVDPSTLVHWVVGNQDAPISNQALFGPFTIETTERPWTEIGLTGFGGNSEAPIALTLRALDADKNELGSFSLDYNPGQAGDVGQPGWMDARNAAAVFLGIRSSVPIFSVEAQSSNLNAVWDNLTFVSVPEPSGVVFANFLLMAVLSRRTLSTRTGH